MAATIDSTSVFTAHPYVIQKTILSSLVSDQLESVAVATGLGAPTITAPFKVDFEWTVPATSNEVASASHVVASDSTSGNTVAVKASVENGGDIAGAKLAVFIWWLNQARQDGQSISQDNNT